MPLTAAAVNDLKNTQHADMLNLQSLVASVADAVSMLDGNLYQMGLYMQEFNSIIDTFLNTHLGPALGVLAQSGGGLYWIGYTMLGVILAYIVLRVIWSVTRLFT